MVRYFVMGRLIAAIDQGTTSTRCILFNEHGPVASAQQEHRQHYPQPGWVEHDPLEIWRSTQEVISAAMLRGQARPGDVAAVGIANQRETCLLWNRKTGKPLGNAIVWQDTRTREFCDQLSADGGQHRFQEITGLPLATYFSGPKIRWLLDHIPDARRLADKGEVLAGTIDSWLIWNLTGGTDGGSHVTDVTNASRTMLMNLKTLEWDERMLQVMDVPKNILPKIVSSIDSASWGKTRSDGPFADAIPVCGCLGDQQAALVGQTCFAPGESKNTYGTGCFMLLNTGTEPVVSRSGLLTTVAYRIAGEKAVYALEGSVAIAGALVQWLRDNLNLIGSSAEIEPLARSVADNGGIYIVPAFSGLFAPYWQSNARGIIAGLTGYAGKAHLARAVLEATAFQTHDVLDAMRKDSGVEPKSLRVDGGMVVNDLLMQFQADILDLPVIRPAVIETTALGAAYAAGLAVGFWNSLDDLSKCWREDKSWKPNMNTESRERLLTGWRKAIERSMNWM
jgi:glycerol kinase